jgi:hypothetical protein
MLMHLASKTKARTSQDLLHKPNSTTDLRLPPQRSKMMMP